MHNVDIVHPLPVGAIVEGTKPSCPCRNAKQIPFRGVIKKVIENHTGIWYYIDIGVTVKADNITAVRGQQ